ncbi:hypothetical protein ILYODFUR_022587 [Ilyodon furcidens]|uniref:Uncharacterized protein n=1 Tax=Ilyodon furcidens TaxID=33524 RepID=A0ABV0UUL7_9TELE
MLLFRLQALFSVTLQKDLNTILYISTTHSCPVTAFVPIRNGLVITGIEVYQRFRKFQFQIMFFAHDAIYFVSCTSPSCSKTSPKHDATTLPLHHWDDVLRLASV